MHDIYFKHAEDANNPKREGLPSLFSSYQPIL